MTPEDYNKKFFELQHSESYNSAKLILPLVLDLFKTNSVLDVGCGSGAWLKAFEEITNSTNYKGIDGNYIDRSTLLIDNKDFIEKNLESEFDINERFDLVISLEVTEHLKASSAESFIKSLIKHSDIILFSAAIPGQEGTHHYNEQFPEYWQAIFNKYDYLCYDCIREKVWDNESIAFWYRQNSLIYIHKSIYRQYLNVDNTSLIQPASLTRIHPELWNYKNKKLAYFQGVANSVKKFIKHKYLKKGLYQ